MFFNYFLLIIAYDYAFWYSAGTVPHYRYRALDLSSKVCTLRFVGTPYCFCLYPSMFM